MIWMQALGNIEPDAVVSTDTRMSAEMTRIYEENAQSIYYFLLRNLGDKHLAEDAMHDVFLKAFKNLRSFRAESKVRTWLYQIAHNHCINVFKSAHHRRMHYEPDLSENLTTPQTNDPLRALEVKELGSRIQEALNQIPDEYRALLLMVADERLSYEQIAELTHQSSDAVRGKLHRARKAFVIRFQTTERKFIPS